MIKHRNAAIAIPAMLSPISNVCFANLAHKFEPWIIHRDTDLDKMVLEIYILVRGVYYCADETANNYESC